MKHSFHLSHSLTSFLKHFLRPYKGVVALYIILSLAAGLWTPFNSLLLRHIINAIPQIAPNNIAVLAWPVFAVVLNFLVFDNVTWRTIYYLRAKFMPKILNQIFGEVLQHTLGQSHQFFQDSLSGQMVKHISNLVDAIEKILGSVASNTLRGASLIVSAVVTAYFVNPIFSGILTIWFVTFGAASLYMSSRLVRLAHRQALCESVIVGEATDLLSNQSNIRLFARKDYEAHRMGGFFEQHRGSYEETTLHIVYMHVVQGGLIAVMMSSACYGLIHLYSQGLVSVGDFILILGMSMETGHMMWFTMSEVDELNKAIGKCKQSLAALLKTPDITDSAQGQDLICTQGEIIFHNVQFSYPGSGPLFQEKSVTISPGEKVGLVGFSGGGKSTFVNLILRMYDVTAGEILIDGQSIRGVTQKSLHTQIAMIPQEPLLFHRSLLDNIRYARLEASIEEVMAASKKAHAHDFIEKLPLGYDTLVGERGVKLSGGQRQRIAIARAILKNAPILILDEATSQLDSVTESEIQGSVWDLMQGKTTIVIAHRLSTLLHMDRILVFAEGKIVEDGQHASLLAQQGLYKSLWDAQVGGFFPESRE